MQRPNAHNDSLCTGGCLATANRHPGGTVWERDNTETQNTRFKLSSKLKGTRRVGWGPVTYATYASAVLEDIFDGSMC